MPKQKEEKSWSELLNQLSENQRQKKILENWKPRAVEEIPYLPYFGDASQLPSDTPERAVAEFIENWIAKRYGLLAQSLLYFTEESSGKKSGKAKKDFGNYIPFRIELFRLMTRPRLFLLLMLN